MARISSMCFYAVIALVTILMATRIMPKATESPKVRNPLRDRNAYEKAYLTGIFWILFICSALRFNIGNDYEQYTNTAHEAFVGGYVVTELGFNWLVKIVYTILGGEYYEVIFAIFAFFTIFLFLKSLYEQSEDFTLSYILFVTLGIYFQTYNTVRYYFVLAICLYAMRFLWEKDWIRFCGWILLASFFHKSVLLVIPVYWIATFTWKKWQIAAGILVSMLAWLGKGIVLELALYLYPSYRNTVYLEGGTSISSIIRAAFVLAICYYCMKKHTFSDEVKKKQFLFYTQLNLLCLVIYVFFSFLPVVTRIAYYLSISQLFLIPLMIYEIKDKKQRRTVYNIIVVGCFLYFIAFLLQADQPGVGLLPYRTWVFEGARFHY